jgi:hypothetical protein
MLQLALNVLLIPGTASAVHLLENLAAEEAEEAEDVALDNLDNKALRELDRVGHHAPDLP